SQEHLLRDGFPESVLSTCSPRDNEPLEPSHPLGEPVVLRPCSPTSHLFPSCFPPFIQVVPARFGYSVTHTSAPGSQTTGRTGCRKRPNQYGASQRAPTERMFMLHRTVSLRFALFVLPLFIF